jgi:hypothetical protein
MAVDWTLLAGPSQSQSESWGPASSYLRFRAAYLTQRYGHSTTWAGDGGRRNGLVLEGGSLNVVPSSACPPHHFRLQPPLPSDQRETGRQRR